MTRTAASAETPEEIWTTVPPAKSSAPSLCSQPPSPQTQWASGVIDQRRPRQHEHDERRELFPLREGTRDERRRDDGEHHLEKHEGLVRDGGGVRRVGLGSHPAQPYPLEAADDAPLVGAERQAIAPEHPLDGDEREDDEAVHQGPERVLLPHHAAVEE